MSKPERGHRPLTIALAIGFFAIALGFVYRSFYGMRIRADEPQPAEKGDILHKAA